jgi:hypothetical protein
VRRFSRRLPAPAPQLGPLFEPGRYRTSPPSLRQSQCNRILLRSWVELVGLSEGRGKACEDATKAMNNMNIPNHLALRLLANARVLLAQHQLASYHRNRA